MKTIYVLYGKKACKLYDESFEKLHTTKHIKFEIAMYRTEEIKRILNQIKKWKYFRLITVIEYGMLLKIIDDKKNINNEFS